MANCVFYIIGAILSLNMITFISWLVCGILLIKINRQNKGVTDSETHLGD